MKLFQQFHGKSMALRALLFSTQAPTRQFLAIAPPQRKTIRVRDPTASDVPISENWVQQGNKIEHPQLQKIITDLFPICFKHALKACSRDYQVPAADFAARLELISTSSVREIEEVERYFDAIPYNLGGYEVYCALLRSYGCLKKGEATMEKLSEMGDKELSAADFAVQLELTSRAHGIGRVKVYFDAIPYNLRGYEVYCALLSSYADHGCSEAAEATMQKIRELGFLRDALPYNVMLSFYYYYYHYIREYNKMNILAEEMRDKGINKDKITYNLLLKLYGDNLMMEEMEQVFRELEADPVVNTNWHHYFLVAQGYWYDGQVDKSLAMLNKSEESMEGDLNRSLYSLHKDFYNDVYHSMIRYFSWNDDMDGAERIWEEWFSKKKEMDFAIPRAMICGYGINRQWEKAEGIVFRMRESGIEPDADTIYSLASAYGESNQIDKAVEASMKAIPASEPGWIPEELYTIADCFEYWESQGNDIAKEELYKMLKEHCGVPKWLCDHLKNCKSSWIPNRYLRSPRGNDE